MGEVGGEEASPFLLRVVGASVTGAWEQQVLPHGASQEKEPFLKAQLFSPSPSQSMRAFWLEFNLQSLRQAQASL